MFHSRAIYSIWDFLGDVGGLFDMLTLLAQPILALSTALFGSGLDRYLMATLFKKEKRYKFNQSIFSLIDQRKSTKVKCCNWLFDRRNRKMHDQA